MQNKGLLTGISIVVIALAFGAMSWWLQNGQPIPEETNNQNNQVITEEVTIPADNTASKSDLLTVSSVKTGDIITSPIVISGQARGNWFFEAVFPIKVVNAQGVVLGTGQAQAQSDWMTSDFVPFTATISFASSMTQNGAVILSKDNPSGLPQNADQVVLRIKFR